MVGARSHSTTIPPPPTNHDSLLSDTPNNRVQLVAWIGWQALPPPPAPVPHLLPTPPLPPFGKD
jgi:hypothetical protein